MYKRQLLVGRSGGVVEAEYLAFERIAVVRQKYRAVVHTERSLAVGLDITDRVPRPVIVPQMCIRDSENSLQKGIEKLKTQVPIDDYFVYGFGAHHLWVHQRKISDPTEYFKCRLMKAEF